MRLSIIIPCYNESATVLEIVNKILNLKYNIEKEVILVDDFSDDGTKEIIRKNFLNHKDIRVIFHDKNSGKGAAIKTAKKFISGDIIIIQDADLEYDPNDYKKLIDPIINNETKVVYGSRVLNQNRYSARGFTSKLRVFGNHVLTVISNILNKQKLTDAHTCYKVFLEKSLIKLT